MTKHTIVRAILLASLACTSSAFAGDIRKCVSAEGRITLTDDACPGDTRTAKVIISQETAPEPVLVTTLAPRTERAAFVPAPVRYVNLARRDKSTRGLSLDTETLRSARIKMQLGDALRGQRMASLQ